MRALSSTMLANIAKTITDPIYLIKMDLGSQYVYASTRESVTYDGNDYITKGASAPKVSGKRVRFTLPNHDRSISALAFEGQIQGNECVVYLHYGGETIGRFTGLLDAPECSGDYNVVTFNVVDAYALISRWPTARMNKPTFNHLPAPGTVIQLGAVNLTLEKDQY